MRCAISRVLGIAIATSCAHAPVSSSTSVSLQPDTKVAASPESRLWEQWLPASKDGRVGYIDHHGAWVIPPQFDYAWPFPRGEDRAMVLRCGLVGYIAPTGRFAIPPRRDLTLPGEWNNYAGRDFHEGRLTYPVAGPADGNGNLVRHYVAIDHDGNEVFRTDRELFNNFAHGLASIARQDVEDTLGFVDRAGRIVIAERPGRCYACEFGEDQRLAVQRIENGKWGFIDRRGEWAIAPQFDQVTPFDHGVARVEKDGKVGLIDPFGAVVVPLGRFEQVYPRFSNGLVEVCVGGRAGFVDRRGDVAVPIQFGSTTRGELSEGLIAIRDPEGNRVGYVNRSGAMVIAPVFLDAGAFHDGVAPAVAPTGRCGYIDHRGRWAVEPLYTRCSDLENGIARVDTRSDRTILVGGLPRPFEYLDASGRIIGTLEAFHPNCARDGGDGKLPAPSPPL